MLGERPDWMAAAACRGKGRRMFPEAVRSPGSRLRGGRKSPSEQKRTATAKRVCAACPVVEQCLEHAISHREREGVWGGLAWDEREAVIRQRRRAA